MADHNVEEQFKKDVLKAKAKYRKRRKFLILSVMSMVLAITLIQTYIYIREKKQISNQLDFSNTQTKIIRLKEDDEVAIKKLYTEKDWHSSLQTDYEAGKRQFYSAIRGIGGYLPTEKLLTYLQALKINTSINLLAFESAYNQLLALIQ